MKIEMETILNRENLQTAYKRVKANGGVPGVDGMQVEAFAEHARQHWPTIAGKLTEGHYQPGAIKGVGSPNRKAGNDYWAYRRCTIG